MTTSGTDGYDPWWVKSWLGVLLLVAPLALGTAATAAAQEVPAVAEARRLRDAGELEAAAARLRAHLGRSPGDVDARWLYAQTLYWTGDVEGARAEYLEALERRPGDTSLRLDVAGFLADTGRPREAARVLEPLAALGGRLPPGVARQVEDLRIRIAKATAPWVAARPAAWSDDQPLDYHGVELEAGFHPARGVSAALVVEPGRYESNDVQVRQAEIVEVGGEIAIRRPEAPIEAELSGGASVRTDVEDADPVGRAAAAVRLPREVRLTAEARRWRYLLTARSLDADLMVDTWEVALDRSAAPGWAGQAGARVDRFPDDNEIASAWAWILAPIVRRGEASLRLGYAFQFQDAEESRFTSIGVYDPYYTPEELVAHSIVAAVSGALAPGVTLAVDGAVALHAEELAPSPSVPGPADDSLLVPPDDVVTVVFAERDFTPWRARARLDADLSPAVSLRLEAEHESSAFFEITRGTAGLVVRFPR
ncbi:MAG: tetratricopeptide repeat protein [Gemmatimonadota bacterium]|nr:tetratricopeptide repeat protein [Gemmatimonadota bacterium]